MPLCMLTMVHSNPQGTNHSCVTPYNCGRIRYTSIMIMAKFQLFQNSMQKPDCHLELPKVHNSKLNTCFHTNRITAHPCTIYGCLSNDNLNGVPQLEIKVLQLRLLVSKAADCPHRREAFLWDTVGLGIGLLPLLCQVLRDESEIHFQGKFHLAIKVL